MARKRSAREPKHQKAEVRLERQSPLRILSLDEKISRKLLGGLFLFHFVLC